MISNFKFLIIGIIALALTSCAKDELESPAAEKTQVEAPGNFEKRSGQMDDIKPLKGASEINDDDDDETGGKPNGPSSK